MKTLMCAALCGLAATTSTASASTLFPHVPLMMWSQRPIFAGTNTYLSAPMDASDVASAMERTLTRDMTVDQEGVLNHQEMWFQQAEVMCLFLLPTLGSEEVSQLAGVVGKSSFVQNALQTSMSSVVIPHTTRTKPLLEEIAAVQPHVVSAQDLQGFLASEEGQALLANGKTDLLVVQLSAMLSLPDVDAAIQSAASTLTEATSGKTDFAFTGNDAESMELEDPVVRRLASQVNAGEATTTIVCDAGYLIGYNAAGTAFCFSHYVNMTPEIMTGLLFGFLFLFLAYVGLSVLNAIQTPTKYPLHGPPRGKEF